MIPKIIHYCWFGRGKMPALEERCLASWRKFLPGYELKLWSEDNFDAGELKFTREAYARRKYAFVADYVRLHALQKFGGIYLDTDVEVLRSFDPLTELPGFIGFESDSLLGTCVLGAEQGAPWLGTLMEYYRKKPFVRWYGKLNDTPNTLIVSRALGRAGVRMDGTEQTFDDALRILPKDCFCPRDYRTGELRLTDRSYSIHHFAGSWK